jgi:CubicO group peptidase (beta-lactamase class C family)
MRFPWIATPALALCVSLPATTAAQVPALSASAPGRYGHGPAIEQARVIARAILDENQLPGLSLAIGVNGAVVHAEGFGFADLENRVPVTPSTRMRIGSISKPVTAAALGLLVERGRLDLDAEVQRYVPKFPRKRWPITVRQVAGHIAGIRHYRGDENMSTRRFATVTAGLDIFAADSLLFEPGTDYSYSSYGWNLLSAVIEGAAGVPFLEFMRRDVFEPLGLRSIVAEHTDSILDWRSDFYQRGEDGRLVHSPYVDNSYKWAGGGFISNTEDLVRFAFAHLDGAFLKPETVRTLWTSQKRRNGEETGYGIGWASEKDPQGRLIVSHTGGSVGGRAVLIVYPEHRVAVAMTSNGEHAPMSVENARKIAELFLK